MEESIGTTKVDNFVDRYRVHVNRNRELRDDLIANRVEMNRITEEKDKVIRLLESYRLVAGELGIELEEEREEQAQPYASQIAVDEDGELQR